MFEIGTPPAAVASGANAGEGAAPAGVGMGQFLRSGIVYWAATLVAGGINLVFNVVAAHRLQPVRYGELAALIALVNLVLIAGGAVSRTVTAVVATVDDLAMTRWLAQRGVGALALLGAAGLAVVGLFAHGIANLLHLNQPLWVWLAAASLVPGYSGAVATGVLQGRRLFREAGAVNVAAAVIKFGVLLALLGAGLGVTGATLATLTEVTVVCVGSLVVIAWRLRGITPRVMPWVREYRDLLGLPVALTVARLLYFNLDILMARHYLSAEQAGLFAALGTTGRIIAYGTGALPPVIYPYLIRFRGDRRLTVRALVLTLSATAAAGGAAIALFYGAPGLVVHLFGSSFAAIAPYIGLYGLAFLFYSLTYILLYYMLASESWWVWAYAVGGSVLEIIGLMLFHRDIAQFTEVVVAFFGLMFVVTALHVARDLARPGPARRAPASAGGGALD